MLEQALSLFSKAETIFNKTPSLIKRSVAGAGIGLWGSQKVASDDPDSKLRWGMGGAILGAALGGTSKLWSPAVKAGFKGVGDHIARMPAKYESTLAALEGRNLGQGIKTYHALTQSFMTMPIMLGGGALAGMAYADHHGMSKWQGALYGAAAGGLARGGVGLHDWWKQDMSRFGAKTLLTTGVSAGLLIHGGMTRDMSMINDASPEPMTGRTQVGATSYHPQDAPPVGMDMRERLNAMNANGAMVFGLHNRRH